MSNQDTREIEQYFGDKPVVTYPSVQATWMKGEINITIRGETVDKVIPQLSQAVSLAMSQVGFHGDKATQPTPSSTTGEKCHVCQSPMNLVTKNKAAGGTYQLLECTNESCNTSEYNGKFYRTNRFPKKKWEK